MAREPKKQAKEQVQDDVLYDNDVQEPEEEEYEEVEEEEYEEESETPAGSRAESLTAGGIFEMVRGLLTPKSKLRQQERIGQTLVAMGAIQEWQLQQAVDEQRRTGHLLGRILLERGYVDAQTVSIALSRLSGLEYASLEKTSSSPEALNAMTESLAVKHKLLPVRLEQDKLTVLIEAPQDRNAIDDVSVLLGMRIHAILTTTDDIRREIKARYHTAKMKHRRPQSMLITPEERAKIAATVMGSGPKEGKSAAQAPRAAQKPGEAPLLRYQHSVMETAGMPVVQLVSMIIEDAVKAGATDIHLDPQEQDMRVRYRVDGVLHEVMRIPENLENAVISRIKIMADINITETRLPQDGHISLIMDSRECDIRVATLPTFLGERVVLRLLDQASVLAGVDSLGLEPDDSEKVQKMIAEPYGMILVTGPTGSGKTTTLYAALSQRNVDTDSIVTLEDPVEYQLTGINQVQIDTDIDLTFARTLRASLRQDIDVLLVGEIRDPETAHIAIRAAMTGHLVFSTLHTNDAPEAIATLRNMGVPAYLIASALTGIIGQRLCRKICTNCKTAFKPAKALLKSIGLPETTKSLYRGQGCDKCYQGGYSGRTGIFEILPMTPELRRLITEERAVEEICKAASLKTLADSCRNKIKDGILAPEEFLRVIRF